MFKRNLAARPIELQEFAAANAVAEVEPAEKWVQEEEKFRNERREVENPRERIQRLVPGFDLKRLFI
ncbi:MAG: hypothetical protein ACXVA9_03915 [Bdellovibrionales bacterium]